jgi:hypothetical protein
MWQADGPNANAPAGARRWRTLTTQPPGAGPKAKLHVLGGGSRSQAV